MEHQHGPYGGWPPGTAGPHAGPCADRARTPYVPRAVERVARRVPRGAHQTGPRPRDRRPSTASAPTEPPPWNVRRATITAWVHSTPRHTPAMTPAPDPEGNTEEHRNQRPRLPSGSRSRCPRPPSPRKVDTPSRRGPPPLDSAPVQATLLVHPASHPCVATEAAEGRCQSGGVGNRPDNRTPYQSPSPCGPDQSPPGVCPPSPCGRRPSPLRATE